MLLQRANSLASAAPAIPDFNTGNPKAEELLCDLRGTPHAFVLACLMDRQIKAEKAWRIPYAIQQRLGTFSFEALSRLSVRRWRRLLSKPSPLHRFNGTMAVVAHAAMQHIGAEYGGDAGRIWSAKPSSATLVLRFLRFAGAGPKIATMAANILVRDFRIPVSDRFSIDVSPDVQVRRVFRRLGLVQPKASSEEIIYAARSLSPEYPGIIDFVAWELGRTSCRARKPRCSECFARAVCPSSAA